MKEKLLNNVRKRVMVWVALASMATLLPAQTYRLSGCVQDENRQPVEVANVLLKQAKDSTYITGMLTDTQGCFSFVPATGRILVAYYPYRQRRPLRSRCAARKQKRWRIDIEIFFRLAGRSDRYGRASRYQASGG